MNRSFLCIERQLLLCVFFLFLSYTSGAFTITFTTNPDQSKFIVDVNSVLADHSGVGIGLSVNHYTEHPDIKRKTSFPVAVKAMNLKTLRWPEGELAESILWSEPPYQRAKPVAAMKGGDIWPYNSKSMFDQETGTPTQSLDFDQFIALCKKTNAEPFVIVPIDAVNKPDGVEWYASEEQILQNAVEMVKYAKNKGYNVKYWEIGNENDYPHSGSKSKQRWTAKQYAEFVVKISRLMKAEDPTILTGANGMTTEQWWATVIPIVSGDVDFLVTHQYFAGAKLSNDQGWYENYKTIMRKGDKDYARNISNLNNYIEKYAAEADKKRLTIAVTETSSFMPNGDTKYYPAVNNFGTALATFEMMTQMLACDRLTYIHYWTSHWGQGTNQLTNSLGPNNEILPTGRVLQLLNSAILKNMVSVKLPDNSEFQDCKVFSFYDPDKNKLNLLVVNRGGQSKSIPIQLPAAKFQNRKSAEVLQFCGANPEDIKPSFGEINTIKSNGDALAIVPSNGYTITLVCF